MKVIKQTIYIVPISDTFGWHEGTRLFYSLKAAKKYASRKNIQTDNIERKQVKFELPDQRKEVSNE